MTSSQLLKIATSACYFHADPERKIFKGKTLLYLEQSMAHWIMSQGALVWMIPSIAQNSKVSLSDYVSQIDGLVLQGGSDVCPKSYGEVALKPEWEGDYIRDQYEIALVKECQKQNKPVLGVCRGAQLLNVAFGGSLYQDIPTQLNTSTNHRHWEIYDQNFHQLQCQPNSYLQKIYAEEGQYPEGKKINSIHHQALKKIGQGLKVEAQSEDGIVEAIKHEGAGYILGVQWHPEFQTENNSSLLDSAPIMKDFLRHCELKK